MRTLGVDLKKKAWEQQFPLHNRWHPAIPAVATVPEDEIFRVECIDWTGGQISNSDTADDVKNVDLTQVHYLSGPIRICDDKQIPAKPGDLLCVELLDVGALENWGFTGTFSRDNGGGFLTDVFPKATKAIWDLEGIYCRSRHIPGVKFAGLIHPGLIGTAPSQELLETWNRREGELVCKGPDGIPHASVLHTRPLAELPNLKGALLGSIARDSDQFKRLASEAARTIPGRENGGNCDIKNLSRGSKIFLPVFVEGANLSIGDMHFSQGDGEVSFCGAIEMSGFLTIRCSILRDGMKQYLGPSPLNINPIFEVGPLNPSYSEWLVFEGISVDSKGTQHFLDASVAYKNAAMNAINYLSGFGWTKEQIYLLLSAAPCEGRINGIVDIPNAVCTLAIPIAIFDIDVRPTKGGPGPRVMKRGDVAHAKL